MSSKKADYRDLLRHQNLLRIANRKLLEELCPKGSDNNLKTLLRYNFDEENYGSIHPNWNILVSEKDKKSNAGTQTKNVETDGDDDGYTSGPVNESEGTASPIDTNGDLMTTPADSSKPIRLVQQKDLGQRRRHSSASHIPEKAKTTSTFHQKCHPKEPSRHFVAIPFPSNLYQSDALTSSSTSQSLEIDITVSHYNKNLL